MTETCQTAEANQADQHANHEARDGSDGSPTSQHSSPLPNEAGSRLRGEWMGHGVGQASPERTSRRQLLTPTLTPPPRVSSAVTLPNPAPNASLTSHGSQVRVMDQEQYAHNQERQAEMLLIHELRQELVKLEIEASERVAGGVPGWAHACI